MLISPFFADSRCGDGRGGWAHQFDCAAEKEPIDGNGGDTGNESGENQHGYVYENPHKSVPPGAAVRVWGKQGMRHSNSVGK
jgi:hypothetical protein